VTVYNDTLHQEYGGNHSMDDTAVRMNLGHYQVGLNAKETDCNLIGQDPSEQVIDHCVQPWPGIL